MMAGRLAGLEKVPVGGGLVSGLATAVCCGGLPLFASIGLGAFFAGLHLWRFILAFVVAGTLLIVGINWLYYRGRVRTGGRRTPLRRAMFVSAGIGLLVMVAGIWLLDWWEHAAEATIHDSVGEGVEEEPEGTGAKALMGALIGLPAGLLLLGLLPFPRQRMTVGLSAQGSPRGASGAEAAMISIRDIKGTVRSRYGAFAAAGGSEEACCAAMAATASFAREHGLYSPAELSSVPELAVNLSRGCGNPTGFADLQSGEVVVDFGSGGGIDVILAARKVGPEGRVMGVDLTPDMIKQARRGVAEADLTDRRIEFREADLADTGLPDGFADVVLSNCVINLCPDKDAVYAEALRILRAGGRIAVSDIILATPIPPELATRFQATWVGCLGGAIAETEYLATIRAAGFTEPMIIARNPLKPPELEAMARCPGEEYTPTPAPEDIAAVQNNVVSIKFTATKPLS